MKKPVLLAVLPEQGGLHTSWWR